MASAIAPLKIEVEMDEAWKEWNERQQNPPRQEYDVVWTYAIPSLVRDVNEKLRNGWRVSGPLVVEKNNDGISSYYQPIVREVR